MNGITRKNPSVIAKVDNIEHAYHVVLLGVLDWAIVTVRRVVWRRSSPGVDQMISRVATSLPLLFEIIEVTTRCQNHWHLLLLTLCVFRDHEWLNGHMKRKYIRGCLQLSSGCHHMLEDV